jgi:hypothetical protein
LIECSEEYSDLLTSSSIFSNDAFANCASGIRTQRPAIIAKVLKRLRVAPEAVSLDRGFEFAAPTTKMCSS